MLPSFNEFQGWALTGIAGILGAFAFWLKLNRTQTEIIKTQGEGGWITQLVKDRDQAVEREKETWKLYSDIKSENDKLRMQGILRDEKIMRMERKIDMLSAILIEYRPDLKVFLQNSGFGEIDLIADPNPVNLHEPLDQPGVDDG